ncbi:hypothetical protein AN964_03445 [Heyndrickxia shackletonii]|uniref:Uncharacterized protein n=1 Tax=Heyndrickxia shackletonii TaxID=157838 RepID=A0A0Q3WVJ6_9BACI|nr:hypothetical protein [Heyndrickxia shackletonii]KQL52671.1 hypothetical protein AN964_03445 [Heyndrickxia shackletonii]NEZ01698.1 hypothetical protein [Heyndrickxia shackletonii]
MQTYKVLGAIFILVSGFMYSIERAVTMLSTNVVIAGFYAGKITGEVPKVEVASVFSNLFVPIFFVLGIILIIYGFRKR